MAIRTQLVNGTVRLRARVNGSSVTSELERRYDLGTEFGWMIEVDHSDVNIYYVQGDHPLPQTTTIADQTLEDNHEPSWYFKAGAYPQSRRPPQGPPEHASVELRELHTEHIRRSSSPSPGQRGAQPEAVLNQIRTLEPPGGIMSRTSVRSLGALPLVVGLAVATSMFTSVATAPPATAATSTQTDILKAHNEARAAVGTAALTWSSPLQQSAQKWADHLAAIHTLQHSGSSGVGENIWGGTKGAFTDTQKVEAWVAEKKNFLPHKKFPDVSSTGRWQDVGHYTQVIWYDTTTVGCGQASDNERDYLVCQYQKPGNFVGQYPLGHA